MSVRTFCLVFLVLLASFGAVACSDSDPMRFNMEGRYLLNMQVDDSNCAWDLLTGEMVVEQDGEDILVGIVGRTEMNPGEANPLSGTFTVTWTDNQGVTQTLQGSSRGFEALSGDYNATRPDSQQLDGCFLIADWSAQRL
jgi:hypothetical protein